MASKWIDFDAEIIKHDPGWYPYGDRTVICKVCGMIINDCEPMSGVPEYWHPLNPKCPHSRTEPPENSYVLFKCKKTRRANKRGGKAWKKDE